MSITHTPAPWKLRTQRAQRIVSTGWHVEAEDGCTLAVVLGEQSKELLANAKLIAAAPDLLAALTALLNYANLGAYERANAVTAARAAIAKATGGSNASQT